MKNNKEDKMNILITGGAGSLGKAFIGLLYKDHDIIVIDNNEWAIAELKNLYPGVQVHLMDFEDYKYNQMPVDMVIHLAAFKHVNLGEEDPHSFINNNVTKTAKFFSECYKFGADILFVSTDKAVEPISTYGFTKALGEKLALHYGGSVARLGNILSSSGSVIPIWEDAIIHQEPLKITDPNMTRFVIEDYDAVLRIWGGFQDGEKIIIPHCKEITVADLASRVLEKHGYKNPQDYKPGIEIIGIRPGEKMREKLSWDHEELNKKEKAK